MGYRSEVHIAVLKKHAKKLDDIMNKHNLLSDVGDFACFTKENYEEYAVYKGAWLKWYPEYNDVKAVTSFLEDDETGTEKLMVCIGEDNSVHSEVGDYWDVFHVDMSVHVDLKEEV
tara:strand:- start:13714 stop:14061 length:348 start_codon:yes stop_codon:yes gene_type:complete